jgi:hypothetical protein
MKLSIKYNSSCSSIFFIFLFPPLSPTPIGLWPAWSGWPHYLDEGRHAGHRPIGVGDKGGNKKMKNMELHELLYFIDNFILYASQNSFYLIALRQSQIHSIQLIPLSEISYFYTISRFLYYCPNYFCESTKCESLLYMNPKNNHTILDLKMK